MLSNLPVRRRLAGARSLLVLVLASAVIAAALHWWRSSSTDLADGGVSGGTTVDADVPAVENLDDELRDALRQAAADAAEEGIEVRVTSGWRSASHQQELLEQAVAEHGSEAEAARWVLTPDTSPHVTGDAVDIGGAEARAWLARFGAGYGLCQVYGNEPWHFELRPEAVEDGCPPPYADPTHDPRSHS